MSTIFKDLMMSKGLLGGRYGTPGGRSKDVQVEEEELQERKKERFNNQNIKYVQGLVHNMISADCATDYQSEVQRGRSQRCAWDRLLCIIGGSELFQLFGCYLLG